MLASLGEVEPLVASTARDASDLIVPTMQSDLFDWRKPAGCTTPTVRLSPSQAGPVYSDRGTSDTLGGLTGRGRVGHRGGDLELF